MSIWLTIGTFVTLPPPQDFAHWRPYHIRHPQDFAQDPLMIYVY